MANDIDGDLNVLHRPAHHFGKLRQLSRLEKFQVIMNNLPCDAVAAAARVQLQQQAFAQCGSSDTCGVE